MKKFLYLRITAIILIVAVFALMVYLVYLWMGHFNYTYLVRFVLIQVMLAMFSSQSVLILFIFRNFYPDREISKTYKIFYLLSVIFTILCNLFFIGGTLYDVVKGHGVDTIPMLILVFLISTALIQILGGRHMIKTIRRNVHQQLENSFV